MPRASDDAEQTSQFAARFSVIETEARGTGHRARQAQRLRLAVLRAIVRLEHDYCVGFRLRGAAVDSLCESRLAGRWRIIYRVDHQRHIPVLLLIGEHIAHAHELSYQRAAVHPSDSLSGRWRWDDIYRQTAFSVGASREEFQEMVDAVRDQDQLKCC